LGTIAYFHRNPLRRLWWMLIGQPLASFRTSKSNRS
jgi:hypothetical protein